jgi:glutaredoxin
MRILIATLILIGAFPASAQMYRWTDSSGKTHFTDTPPPAGARNVQRKASQTGGAVADTAGLPFALQQAMKTSPVTLYTTAGCEACVEARKLLNRRGIPFKEVGVASEAQLAELKSAVGSNSVPAMVVGGAVVKGFEEGQYNAALDGAGYPRAGILQPRAQAEPAANPPQAPGEQPVPATEQPARRPGPYAPR